MQPRRNTSIDMLLAQAQEKLRELKELQFFGGDALNLKRQSYTLSLPADSTPHCWRIVMTPEDPEKSMPLDATLKPGNTTTFAGGQIEAVHRNDNKFEYLIITQPNYEAVPIPLSVSIEYSGKATFTNTQIG